MVVKAESLVLVLSHACTQSHRLGHQEGPGWLADVGVLDPDVQEVLQRICVIGIDKVADC